MLMWNHSKKILLTFSGEDLMIFISMITKFLKTPSIGNKEGQQTNFPVLFISHINWYNFRAISQIKFR